MKQLIKKLLENTRLILVYKICKFTDKELLEVVAKNNETNFDFIKDSTNLFIDKFDKIEQKTKSEDDYTARIMFLAYRNPGEDFDDFCIRKDLKPAILAKYKLYKSLCKDNSSSKSIITTLRKDYTSRMYYKIEKSIEGEKLDEKTLKEQIEILKKSVDNLEKLPEDIKKDLIFKNNYNPLGRNLLDEKQPFDIYDIIRDKEIENEIDKSRVTPGFNAFKVFSNHIDKDKKTTSSIR